MHAKNSFQKPERSQKYKECRNLRSVGPKPEDTFCFLHQCGVILPLWFRKHVESVEPVRIKRFETKSCGNHPSSEVLFQDTFLGGTQ